MLLYYDARRSGRRAEGEEQQDVLCCEGLGQVVDVDVRTRIERGPREGSSDGSMWTRRAAENGAGRERWGQGGDGNKGR